jgi:alpha-methylacyl-CoA racemase
MGPLAGVRVIEFAGIGPAPFCGMLLADLGADVVLVERPEGGGPPEVPRPFDVLHRGKRSIVLDLKTPEGVAAARTLAARADVLLEGFRPGVMERIGLGPETCLAGNPRLVYGRMTGWGQSGPLSPRAGHDIDYLAMSGALHAIGRRGGPPQVPLNLVGDFGGGALYLAFGVLAATVHARDTGQGQVVDAAIVDGVASLLAPIYGLMSAGFWRDRRGSNVLDSGAPFYDVYETADGKHLALGALEPKFYDQLIAGLGLDPPTLPGQWEFARWGELRQRFADVIRTRTREEWERVFEGSDACVSPVLSLVDATESAHARARNTYLEREGTLQPAPAPRFSLTPGAVRAQPPQRGAHTAEVLREAGLGEQAVPPIHRTNG